jgi:hypothetical protein
MAAFSEQGQKMERAEDRPSYRGFSGMSIGGQWFLSYTKGKEWETRYSEFIINRGYIIIKKEFNAFMSGRITPDISVDREGDGEGDLEMRLKYCYIDFKLPDFYFFSRPIIEFGLVHRPWLHYEEKINRYRAQGTMFLERNDLFNSGDYGITITALLGKKMAFDHISTFGQYGSISFGFYNGGGYHAIERNLNKSFESRLSLRPFYAFWPGLQISYCGVIAKGNSVSSPDWTVNALFLAHENRFSTLTFMYYYGKGDYKGAVVDKSDTAIEQDGFSVFSELKFNTIRSTFFARYDYFHYKEYYVPDVRKRLIFGLSYMFSKNCRLLLDFDHLDARRENSAVKFTTEVNF